MEFWRIKNFARNLWVFRKSLYNYTSWDYSGTLDIMETSFRDMSVSHAKYSMHTNNEKVAKDLLVLAALCKRIREDNYGMDCADYSAWDRDIESDLPFGKPVENKFPKYGTESFYKDIDNIKKHDIELFIKIFKRKILHCWH